MEKWHFIPKRKKYHHENNQNIKYNKLKNSNNVLSREAGVTAYVSQASTIRAAFVVFVAAK